MSKYDEQLHDIADSLRSIATSLQLGRRQNHIWTPDPADSPSRPDTHTPFTAEDIPIEVYKQSTILVILKHYAEKSERGVDLPPVEFIYQKDQRNELSERRSGTFLSLDQSNQYDYILSIYDEDRDEPRCFRVDRIERLVLR